MDSEGINLLSTKYIIYFCNQSKIMLILILINYYRRTLGWSRLLGDLMG